MRSVSDRFLAAVRTSHLVASRCELTFPGDPTAVVVPIESGQITCDRTANNRRVGRVEVPWSLRAGEDLGVDLRTLPLGGYCRVWQGVRFGDGTSELVKLGTMRVESATWRTPEGIAALELADRMAQVRDEPFTVPLAVAGMRPADAAIAVVQAVFGSTIAYHKPNDPASTMGDTVFTGQRTEALTTLEQSGNGESYFDADGDFVFDFKAGETDPVFTIDAGENGVMVTGVESLDRTGVYNGVLVTGQDVATQAPVYGLATDNDPASPTRWGGPFGHVAMLAQSQVGTTAEAQANAESLIALRLKLTRNLTLEAAPNPALEAGDVIRVVFPDGRVEQHLIDASTVDLATGVQTILTRSRFTPTPLLAASESLTAIPSSWERVE